MGLVETTYVEYEIRLHQNDITWHSCLIIKGTREIAFQQNIHVCNELNVDIGLAEGFLKSDIRIAWRVAFRFTRPEEISEQFTELIFKMDNDIWHLQIRRIS